MYVFPRVHLVFTIHCKKNYTRLNLFSLLIIDNRDHMTYFELRFENIDIIYHWLKETSHYPVYQQNQNYYIMLI